MLDAALKVAEYFDVSLDYLFAEELGRNPDTVSRMVANNVTGSALVQGGAGNTVSVGDASAPQGLEAELLRVFHGLSKMNQAQALAKLYELEAAQEAARKDVE